jgi:hypothetical protein
MEGNRRMRLSSYRGILFSNVDSQTGGSVSWYRKHRYPDKPPIKDQVAFWIWLIFLVCCAVLIALEFI